MTKNANTEFDPDEYPPEPTNARTSTPTEDGGKLDSAEPADPCVNDAPCESEACPCCGSPLAEATKPPLILHGVQGPAAGLSVPFTDQCIIGKGDACHFQVADDEYLSRTHASIHVNGDAISIQDMASANGLFLRINSGFLLQIGDEILAGRSVLRLTQADKQERADA